MFLGGKKSLQSSSVSSYVDERNRWYLEIILICICVGIYMTWHMSEGHDYVRGSEGSL